MLTGAYYPELSGGGLQCRTLVNALKASVGFTVLATSRRSGLPALASVDGVPVHACASAATGENSRLPRGDCYGRSSASDGMWTLSTSTGFTSKMLAIYALARLFGKRIVEKAHVGRWDDPLTMSRAGLSGSVYARADAFVSVSPGMTARFRASRIPPARVREIPNGVDLRRFRPASSAEEVRALRVSSGCPPRRRSSSPWDFSPATRRRTSSSRRGGASRRQRDSLTCCSSARPIPPTSRWTPR